MSRITPAYAGNTQMYQRIRTVQSGSPPPTRGTHYNSYVELNGIGITPAYAGNTVIRSLKHAMSDYINP